MLALFADSTNATRPGHTGSELDVHPALEDIFASTKGRLVVTTFASSLHRIQLLIDLADQFGRQVAFIGRGVRENADIAERLGYLRIPNGLRLPEADVRHCPPDTVLCIVTGSQGEPLSALSRIAVDSHRHVSLDPGDVVVFSARAIPGNQRAIGRLMNHIARRGARVVDESSKPVHVSGHGSEEELKLMTSLVRPRYFVPIHGGVPLPRASRDGSRTGHGWRYDGAAGGERRPDLLRRRWRLDRQVGPGRPRADRRHPEPAKWSTRSCATAGIWPATVWS